MRTIWFHDILPMQASDMIDYCHEHSLSLIRFEETDVTDLSRSYDTLFAFDFQDDDDAIIFKLRYNGV